jgi:Protein involved in formate dehydrogenase formation
LQPHSEAAAPLAVLEAVLESQVQRSADPALRSVVDAARSQLKLNRITDRFPLLELGPMIDSVVDEVGEVVGAVTQSTVVPGPLAEVGRDLASQPELRAAVSTWMDDPALLDARAGFWIRSAAAPLLEGAASGADVPSKEEWTGAACPVCGGPPQVSVIAEESGEFMAGSPRYLVCSRCASWWGYARATCISCGEDDSTRLGAYAPEDARWARIDTCDVCRSYVKAFDLREPNTVGVVPLVDDVATLVLDLWAQEQGFVRPSVSVAGV